jgi:hypothetical protein
MKVTLKVTMDMSNYEIEYETIDDEYCDEIMCSGWIPEVDSVCPQLQLVQTSDQSAMPEGLATEDVELFLRKMCSYQH